MAARRPRRKVKKNPPAAANAIAYLVLFLGL